MNTKRIRIAINAQIDPHGVFAGGIQSVLKDLIYALGCLSGGTEEYILICPWNDTGWLTPYIGPNQSIVKAPHPNSDSKSRFLFNPIKSFAFKTLKKFLKGFKPAFIRPYIWPEVPVSDGFYESLDCQVIHFPFQAYILCAIPTIYNPHDLQHLHFPQYFTPQIIAYREAIFPTACRLAHTVATGSNWIKQDIIRNYKIDADKIQVIPWATPNQTFANPSEDLKNTVLAQYNLHIPFTFYPAMTWEHKNHLRLLEALAWLRDRENIVIRLVCTGARIAGFWPNIEKKISDLNLQSQVQFLDVVPEDHLRAIYSLSQLVVIPTLFEAASGPIFEAWQEGIPVACSTVTSLPEQVRDAAILFDPYSVEAIADAINNLSSDEMLRNSLVQKGYQRLSDFSWERTAKAYRAVYRKAARIPLSDEDHWLLSKDWMRDSTYLGV